VAAAGRPDRGGAGRGRLVGSGAGPDERGHRGAARGQRGLVTRRTGTSRRHVAAAGDRLEQFAARAGRAALARAGLAAADVDAVLVGTTSAEEMSPHAAPLVAADLGATGAAAIDISAACTGFLSCLVMGTAMIESGRARTVLAIGADLLSATWTRTIPARPCCSATGPGRSC
jgi:3-oxoacyl-[acyl-carrier-protein] synthase-3